VRDDDQSKGDGEGESNGDSADTWDWASMNLSLMIGLVNDPEPTKYLSDYGCEGNTDEKGDER
jgi:hypothetical protein